MNFFVKTYGCQMNERDSEGLRSQLVCRGHHPVESESEADLVIVNTCSVRGKAEDKALGKLGLLVSGKRDAPCKIIGAVGCMAQRLGESILDRVPGLDFAVGTFRLSRAAEVVELVRQGRGPVVDVSDHDTRVQESYGHDRGKVSAFVNVMFGCSRRCTYCVVPGVRGEETSRLSRDVLIEIEALVSDGVKDVTLLGQSVTSYGRRHEVWGRGTRSPGGFLEPLPRLLEAAAGVRGLERLRFTSNHPSGCTAELARAIAFLPPVCEHLHLPLQSGSDRLLGMMGRGYTADDYRRAVARLRRAVPHLALTTDVIVGFPSEREEDFGMTRNLMREIGFDNAFIFKYSPRPGTVAADWDDDVPEAEKLRRNKVLLADQDRMGLSINERMVGRQVDVLVEGVSLRDKSRWCGRARTNKIVIFEPAENVVPGDIVAIRVERPRPQTLYGSLSAYVKAGTVCES